MILTDKDIKKELGKERDFISPFVDEHLHSASYDVTINAIVREIISYSDVVDLADQDKIDAMYSSVDISDGFIIKPGQYILCTLNEKVTLPENVIARVMPRTRLTRMGLLIAGQFCNPTYSGVLQIGLQNVSPNNIKITKGIAVAQLVFEYLNGSPSEGKLYRNQKSAAYQNEIDFIGAKFDNELTGDAKSFYDKLVNKIMSED